MTEATAPTAATYNPNRLLDALRGKLELNNDAALARVLDVSPPTLSKIRHLRTVVSPALMIRMHDVTGMTLGEIRDLMGEI